MPSIADNLMSQDKFHLRVQRLNKQKNIIVSECINSERKTYTITIFSWNQNELYHRKFNK